jgi:hypothetical protein
LSRCSWMLFSVYGKTFMDCLANLDKILTEDQERLSGRWMTAPQWWVIDNGCWTDSWLSAQV